MQYYNNMRIKERLGSLSPIEYRLGSIKKTRQFFYPVQ
ncbi:hypothetical protein G7084_05255 [Weissella coleopterorum]|uniref:Integrase catalytic domain-containing protein n=1 Tax=Weissella coleopterorum TaxID=2714949 RepID=A0A6G8B279_9LACO|nr:hypothetical protein G7084_05255 [Weissella coleopterorum]